MVNPDIGETSVLERLYRSRFSEDSETYLRWRRRVWRILVRDFFSRWIPTESTVLDFGSGLGEFINAVTARRRVAVDLREAAARHLSPEVEFVTAGPDWTGEVGPGTVDVVFCSNLLEHLPDRETVLSLFDDFGRVLKPGGRLLILGPNLRYSGPRYWDFFDHILPLTHLSLAEALETAGYGVQTLLPRFLPFTTVGAWRAPLPLIRLYLRVPIVWRLMGAQFFAVATPNASG